MCKMNSTALDSLRKGLVLGTASRLMIPTNQVTTLEIKTDLRKNHSAYYWDQAFVSACMDDFATQGVFNYTDNGTYRTYYDPTKVATKTPSKASKTVAKASTKKTGKTMAKTTANSKWTTTQSISRTKAIDLMKNNKGHFFSVQFVKKGDSSLRTMNCQWLPNQTPTLGVIKVKEASLVRAKNPNPVRSFDIDTVTALSIAGNIYKVRK